MSIKITSKHFEQIKTLLENESIKKSSFKNETLLKAFIDCGCVIFISGTSRMISLQDEEVLFRVIKSNKYDVNSIEDLDYFINQNNEPISRDEVSEKFSDSKKIKSKSFNGLTIAVSDKLEVKINDKKQNIYPIEGTGLFIHYTSSFQLDDDIIVVGVENPQVVWYINKYRHLFDENKKYLFLSISEYKTNYQYQWLESFEGEYIHFGDFDLAGANIYINTIIPKLKKAKKYSFLIPDNIYEIMKKRNYKKDYQNQLNYRNIESKDDLILQKLISFIKKYKITLEQEMLSK